MDKPDEYGPWDPGILSQMPLDVLKRSTFLSADNILQSFDEVEEIRAFTGLAREDIVAFRPQRMAIHELLIRISANYSVSDGNQYEDLGFNFRRMAQTLFDRYLQPRMAEVNAYFDNLRREIYEKVMAELDASLFKVGQPEKAPAGFWRGLLKPKEKPLPAVPAEIRDAQILAGWQAHAEQQSTDPLQPVLYKSLWRVCTAIMNQHGRIRGEKHLLAALVTQRICNDYGSSRIGTFIEPIIAAGAKQERFLLLPIQADPIIMNVKGSSAAGKSTLRPLQHKLAQRLGLKWEEFALISPDIWRKFLLDYESLGDAYKYAGNCSGHELKIVDQKLDKYMAEKAADNSVPHLLIDRFRFDSFAEKSTEQGSNLLTRFAARVYMFYMITPPDATVERAWSRGVKVGRYKAVDDLLDHNVEAFSGMPQLFFTWALNQEKDVHYEFLDNSVAMGKQPRTVAFGENGTLNILDVKCMMDIDRFRKIRIEADTAADVYPTGDEMMPANNIQFINDCIKRLARVVIADFESTDIAMRFENGELQEWNAQLLACAIPDQSSREAILTMYPNADDAEVDSMTTPRQLVINGIETLGRWGH